MLGYNDSPATGIYTHVATNSFLTIKCSYSRKTKISIYPNPTIGFIHLKSVGQDYNHTYKVYFIDGLMVKEGNVSSDLNIDVSNLPKGIFFLSIERKNTIVLKERIVKL